MLLFFELEWYNSSLVESGGASGMSESEIHQQLNAGSEGLGVYSLDLTVDAEAGGGTGCQHTDDGEEIVYTIQLLILDYSVEAAS